MGGTSRTRISKIFYIKKVIEKISQIYRPISTLTIKFIQVILKNRIQETLDTSIDEHQSGAIDNRIICDIIHVSNKLNKNISALSL